MQLSNFTEGKDNNFNLIRIVAALAVLVTHSFALAIGTGDAEPFQKSLGMTIGTIAVDVFFIASGFLVIGSLLTKQSVIEFVWARVLRIFPALLIMLIFTVFVLGLFFTSLPASSYLADSKTHIYLATLGLAASYSLPGVFDGNPFKNPVNGSLWTLQYEIMMYAILAIAWAALGIIKRNRLRVFELAVVTSTAVVGFLVVVLHLHSSAGGPFARLFFMFMSGATFFILKEQITLSRSLFWLFVFSLLLSAFVNKHAFFVVYLLTIAYILFTAAYIPSGWIRKYNQVGDYSYGVYIYAFPIQQSVAALVPGISVLSMLLISAFVTLLLAALSWHLIERRVLRLKERYVGHTRRMLQPCVCINRSL